MTDRYKKSEILYRQAEKLIPLGSQTFSKSILQFPLGVSPLFADKAKGCYLWDVDGNKYIDFINSLASITLGYSDKDINKAVKKQIDNGTIFSLSHSLEKKVAQLIVNMVPSAEKVRFGKNGSDATAASIRLARAYTKKDHIAVCGYHGWQDWYIGSTSRNKGVPKSIQKLTHKFMFNKLDSISKIFKKFPNNVAAVILEPMNVQYPVNNFLDELKELTHKNRALLIFDETITGFRFSNGGAQKYFNVSPDLSTFGKGIANGYPLSAIVGSGKYMRLMEEIFFSATFGGETISLTASNITLQKLIKKQVCSYLHKLGQYLENNLKSMIIKYNLEEFLYISGHPSWIFLNIKESEKFDQLELKSLIQQEFFARGFLFIGSHNLSLSHDKKHVDLLLKAYEEIFELIYQAIFKNKMQVLLKCKPIKGVFKIR